MLKTSRIGIDPPSCGLKMPRPYCCLLLFAGLLRLSAYPAMGQDFIPVYAKAYRLALKLKADSARLLTAIPSPDPEIEAQRLLIQSLTDMLENMVRENDDPPPGYLDRQDARIKTLDDVRHPGPWARHALAECYLHRGLSQGRFGQEIRAALSVTKAYSRSKDLYKDQPDFLPARKAVGVYQIVLGLIPGGRNWLMRLAGIKGDVEGGLVSLKQCAETPNAQQDEAILLYSLVQMYVRDQSEQGRANLLRYIHDQRDDLAGLTILASAYKYDHQQGRALAALKSIHRDGSHLPFYYPLLMEGELFLQDLQPDSAIPYLERYLAVCSQRRLVKNLHYQLFVAYYLKGDSLAANANFFAISSEGEVGTDGDRYALYFFKRGLIPDKRLLKARLLIDGGFTDRAQAILDSIPPGQLHSITDLAELSYRRARLAQRRKDTAAADRLFRLTVLTAADDPSYYAPMSCLQLGQIAYRAKRYDEARAWLERVSTYPVHEYKEGLDERARSWIKRVKKAD